MHILAENASIASGPVLIPARALPRWESKGWRAVDAVDVEQTPEADATSDEDTPTIPVDPFDFTPQEG